MKKINPKKYRVGVIIGRFQAPELHAGHKCIIDFALKHNEKVIILVGSSGISPTIRNPLKFKDRKIMIKEHYPQDNILITALWDTGNLISWSQQIDDKLSKILKSKESAVIYGSRDSVVSKKQYLGIHDTYLVKEVKNQSGTKLRESVNKGPKNKDYRRGKIAARQEHYPKVYPCTDIAIVDDIQNPQYVLLGRKGTEQRFRFPGGFLDPTDASLEHGAVREAKEETGVDINPKNAKYIGSFLTNDYRYQHEIDKITTSFFVAEWKGDAKAGDDLAEVKWFKFEDLNKKGIVYAEEPGDMDYEYIEYEETIVRGHQGLYKRLLSYLNDNF